MKKTYETPSIEKIAFQYRDQVVAASGNVCYVSHQRVPNTNECEGEDVTHTN